MIELALTANLVFFVMLVWWLASRKYMNVFSGLMVYCVFHFLVFVQRPIIVYAFDIISEYEFMNFVPDDDIFLETILVSNVGLVSFVFGYVWALGFRPLRMNFNVTANVRNEGTAYLISFLILSPLIAYSIYLMLTMRQEYGVEVLDELGRIDMTVDPATGSRLFVDTTGYFVLARNMLLPFVTFIILRYRGRSWSYLPSAAAALLTAGTGGRWPLVMSLLVVMMIGLYVHRRSGLTALSYISIVAGLVVFVVVGENRDALMNLLVNGTFEFELDLSKTSFGAHPDFANFEFLTFVIAKVPEVSETYSYFTQYLGVFTWPIPRMLWPDKPVGSPITLVNLQDYGQFASRTTSLVGDGWISLGYPGVVITLVLAGVVYGYLYKRMCGGPVSSFRLCAYVWMVALLAQWARDGGYRILEFYFFCVTPIGLAYLVYLSLSPRPRRAPRRPDNGAVDAGPR